MGAVLHPVANEVDGTMALAAVDEAIRVSDVHYARAGLLAVENTHNACGGRVLPLAYMQSLRALGGRRGVPVHLDGARLMNAAAALGVGAPELTATVDSVSMCLSKGLGAPVGSLLAGPKDFVREARFVRKALGGGMRQAGVLAAAGLVALQQNAPRVHEDNARAQQLSQLLGGYPGQLRLRFPSPDSNMVFFEVLCMERADFLARLAAHNVLMGQSYSTTGVRAVVHLDVSDNDLDTVRLALDAVLAGEEAVAN